MIPNDHIKKQGWKAMEILLDKEMPVEKSNRRYIFPFFWSIGILLLVTISLLWLMHNPEAKNISKFETIELIATSPINLKSNESTQPSQNETLKSKVSPIRSKDIVLIANSRNVTTETLENKKSKQNSPIFKSDRDINNDSLIQYQNDNLKEKTNFLFNELKYQSEITNIVNQGLKQDLNEEPIQNERKTSIIADVGTQIYYPISQKINDSLVLNVQQDLSYNPLTSKKQNYHFGLTLGIGQNLTIKSNNSMQFGFFVEKSISQGHGIIFTSSIEISRMDLKIKIDTMNSSLTAQFENSVGNLINQNPVSYFNVNTFNPGFIVQSTGNLSYVRYLNNQFFFQGGIEMSYLVDIQEKNSGLEKDRNLSVSNEYGKSNLNKIQSIIYNKWDIAPTLGLGYKFTKNISISTQYRHGLISLIKYPIESNDVIRFRNLMAKINYTF